MAARIAQDVVKEAQSMGGASPVDDPANAALDSSAGNGQASHLSYAFEPTGQRDAEDILVSGNEDLPPVFDGPDTPDITSNAGDGPGGQSAPAGDGSGGSDTDTSRNESLVNSQGMSRGHVRSNSMKKPAAFKSVSVTKNFLAKAATSSPSTRPGDRVASPSSQSGASTPLGARPRLVAKSALGGSTARIGLGAANGVSGPDPMKVWNKNQPVAPPTPRQFTDEELKQQYGIHMATRLQADEVGKESKWADIDDDEDDWAPETVEWVDGTKSNVVAPSVQPITPALENKPSEIPDESEKENAESIHLLPSQPPTTTITSSTKTILKPGALAATQSKTVAAASRPSTEGAAGPDKSPAPPPTKSPWAKLPPVEKIPPVFPNPPPHNPPSAQPAFRRDPHGFDAAFSSHHTREIAADTFDRSWQPEERGTRELFNSRSGRYEPVNDARRRPSREEYGYRQPAVLQRPYASDRSAPYDQSRYVASSEVQPPWNRRRTSSNVSNSGRRLSVTLVSDGRSGGLSPISVAVTDSPQQRYVLPDTDNAGSGQKEQRHTGTFSGDANQQTGERGSADQPSEVLQHHIPSISQPQEDPVAVQQRLIRESRERAKLKKEQQRAKEEEEAAAKRERLRLKMEALSQPSPPPEQKVKLAHEQGQSSPSLVPEPGKHNLIVAPKPPIPTNEGEVAQYGLMKVHQAHPVKKPGNHDGVATSRSPLLSSEHELGYSATSALGKSSTEQNPGRHTHQSLDGLRAEQHQVQTPATPNTADPWKSTSSSATYHWNNSNVVGKTSGGSNVWGPPQNRERGLGNGTFGNAYNSAALEGNASTDGLDSVHMQTRDPDLVSTVSGGHPSSNRLPSQGSFDGESRIPPTSADMRSATQPRLHRQSPGSGPLQGSASGNLGSSGSSMPPAVQLPGQNSGFGSSTGFDLKKYATSRTDTQPAGFARNTMPDSRDRSNHWTVYANGLNHAETQKKLADLEKFKREHQLPEILDDDQLKQMIKQYSEQVPSLRQDPAYGDPAAASSMAQGRVIPPHLRATPKSRFGTADSLNIGSSRSDNKPSYGAVVNAVGGPVPSAQSAFRQAQAASVIRPTVGLPIGAERASGAGSAVHVSKFMSFFPTERQMPAQPVEQDCRSPEDAGLFGDANDVKVVLPAPKAIVKLPNRAKQAEPAINREEKLASLQKQTPSVALGMIQNLLRPTMTTRVEFEVMLQPTVVSLPSPSTATTFLQPLDVTSKPLADILFEDREFASLPGVSVPKADYRDIHLAPYRRNQPRGSVDAQTVITDPLSAIAAASISYVLIRLPGAARPISVALPAQTRSRQTSSGFRMQKMKPRTNVVGRTQRSPGSVSPQGSTVTTPKGRIGSWTTKHSHNGWNQGGPAANRSSWNAGGAASNTT